MWERNAIIYGVDLTLFADGDGDGRGDMPGLIERLDYLADLGINCLWLLPCFPSAARDNGYDIEDHYHLDPRLGTFADLDRLVREADARDMRVLLDLVVDHTSNRHPWFEAARRDPRSRYRDYYVWAEKRPPVQPGKGSIFPGESSGVWSRDPIAGLWYYHRFYDFEPGLNGANPEVIEEIKRIIDYWLSFGIAGFRFDAASHLVEQKGLARTEPKDPHGVLREIFASLRARRPDGALLAEADVRPEDIASFIGGGGGQFSLMFNFLLNNYLWLAFATGRAEPLARCLDMLPAWGGHGYWANFLRNLDEADLERLDDSERAAVMDAFAPEETMRIYGRGIRRRLAPMLGDTRRVKLAMSLLFSLPGAPLLVYGDEIGMGEDLELPGRTSVRTPMQWDASANAGFSRAASERLCAPLIADGPFSYEKVNVAAQRDQPESLLALVRRLCELRRRYPQLADEPLRRLDAGHPAVWAHGARDGSLVLLHNLGRDAVQVEARVLDRSAGARELFSGESCRLEQGVLRRRLEPYGYVWLALEAAPAPAY